jgi:hypothetical protein
MVAFESRREYWYLCGTSGKLKSAGVHDSYTDCEETLEEKGIDAVWIFAVNEVIGENFSKKNRDTP